MAIFINPAIVSDGLTLYMDSLNDTSFKGEPTVNFVSYNPPSASRYNNPGFSGTVTMTADRYKESPIWEMTYVPQAESYISRLASTEGFGCYHSMGTYLDKTKKYVASIYFKTDYPLFQNSNQGFINTYSNIPGWGFENTRYSRYDEAGWTRLFCKWGMTDYIQRYGYSSFNVTVNTTSTQNIIVSTTILSQHLPDYNYLYAVGSHNPSITNNAGIAGLSIVNHGMDSSNWTKLVYPTNIRLKSQVPYTYYFLLSVPSTGGVNKTITIRPSPQVYLDAATDNKYWKVTFDTANLKVNDVIKTYWTCPMIEEIDASYPSTFVIGSRGDTVDTGGGVIDLSPTKNTGTVNSVTFNAGSEKGLIFDGIDDSIKFSYLPTDLNGNPVFTVSSFIKRTGRVTNGGFWGMGGDSSLTGISCYTLADNKITIDLAGVATFSTNIDYPLNQFVNITWVKRAGNFNTTNISIFVNGIEYTGTDLVVIRGSTHVPNLNTSAKGFILGSSSTETASFYVPGVISMFIVYNKMLTRSEIVQNYNSYCNRFGLSSIL